MVLLPLGSMEKDYGVQRSQQITFDPMWMVLTWAKAYSGGGGVCVCLSALL